MKLVHLKFPCVEVQASRPSFMPINKTILNLIHRQTPKNAAKNANTGAEPGVSANQTPLRATRYSPPRHSDLRIRAASVSQPEVLSTSSQFKAHHKLAELNRKLHAFAKTPKGATASPAANMFKDCLEYANLISDHLKHPNLTGTPNDAFKMARYDRKINETCRRDSLSFWKISPVFLSRKKKA